MAELIASNPTSESSANLLNMQDNHPSDSASYLSAAGLAIGMPSNVSTVTSIKFYLKKSGLPTGNAICRIYAATGTLGTNAVPTGSVLVSSGNFDVSTLTTDYALYEFTFTSPYEVTPGAAYCFILENPATGIETSKYPIMNGSTNNNAATNMPYFINGGWGTETFEPIYYLYGTIITNLNFAGYLEI